MWKFTDIFKKKYLLTKDQWAHIRRSHSEITLEIISQCLSKPIEIRSSKLNDSVYLYYLVKNSSRFFCVVTVEYNKTNFISTANTCESIKSGELIYKK